MMLLLVDDEKRRATGGKERTTGTRDLIADVGRSKQA